MHLHGCLLVEARDSRRPLIQLLGRVVRSASHAAHSAAARPERLERPAAPLARVGSDGQHRVQQQLAGLRNRRVGEKRQELCFISELAAALFPERPFDQSG